MTNIFLWIEGAVAILLCLCILIQHRVSGLTSTFGGSGAVYVQRRGAEKVIYKLTIILSIAFFGIAVLLWYLPS
ncbi:MAG: preprotein translocase subunit SecG [Candidatus Peribacteraceae bacterium]|nr:preprotein translocase subunit SecG [Candidatus Peribacteraceae bacterium]